MRCVAPAALALLAGALAEASGGREAERDRLLELIREAQLLTVAKQAFIDYLKLGVMEVEAIDALAKDAMQTLTSGWSTDSAADFTKRYKALHDALDAIPAWHGFQEHRKDAREL